MKEIKMVIIINHNYKQVLRNYKVLKDFKVVCLYAVFYSIGSYFLNFKIMLCKS